MIASDLKNVVVELVEDDQPADILVAWTERTSDIDRPAPVVR